MSGTSSRSYTRELTPRVRMHLASIEAVKSAVASNLGMSMGFDALWGYDPLVLRRYAELLFASQNFDADYASQYLAFRQVAPGIFRDIFQMTPFDPKVQRRDDEPGSNSGEGVRASSTVGKSGKAGDDGKPTGAPGTVVGSDTVDGWNSQTVSPPTRKQ